MPSDALQSLVLVIALFGSLLLGRFVATTVARARAAQGVHAAASGGASGTRRPVRHSPPPLPRHAAAPPSIPLDVPHVRRLRRPSLAEARAGIVLAAILGPCRGRQDEL